MAIIDNTLAAQIPTFDPATPLAEAAKIQSAQAETQAAQFKQRQAEIGSEARGLQPFVNTPDFPAKWAETADRMHEKGLLDDRSYQQWRNTPSPLLLKQMIAQTEDPALSFRKDEAVRDQKNQDFSHGIQSQQLTLAKRAADRADEGPEEVADQRASAATKIGLLPGSPEYKTYALTGKLPDSMTSGADPAALKTLTPGGEIYHTENGKVVVDHKNDKNVNAEDVPQATIDFLADRVRMGDPNVKIGYARNPGMIAKIDSAAEQRETAGIPVSETARSVVGNKVTLSARGAAERKLGTINTNNEFYGNNALGALDIAEKASADVPRTNYPGVNKALIAYRTNSGDPKTVALGAALNTVVNDYAKFTGGGVGTDSLRGHAEEILNGAHSDEQLKSIVHMMRLEIKRGQQSPGMVREGFDSLYAPRGSGGGKPTSAPADRFKQLMGTGLSKEEAYAKMHEEGY